MRPKKREGDPATLARAFDRLPLNSLRVFEAVARDLSFGNAAEALHVTPAAVSQQIKALEDYLQTPLLRRKGRKVELTPEGAQLLPGVRRGLEELLTSLQQFRQQRHAGALRVSTLSSFLQLWLTPRLADFSARFPDIQLGFQTSPEKVDFSRADVHAAIRLGAGRYAGLHSEKIMDECLVIVAAPGLVRKHGRIKTPSDLESVPFIHSDDQDFAATALSAGLARPVRGGTFLDDSASVLTAAIVGAGYALTRWSLAARSVHSGALTLASDLTLPYRYAYFFVTPPAYLAMPKVQNFREWLKEQARAFAAPRA